MEPLPRGKRSHLEILVPGVRPGAALLRPLGSADEGRLRVVVPYIKTVSGPPTETAGRERRWVLADRLAGAGTARVAAVERTRPEEPGTPTNRNTDRLVIVIEGLLDTEIGVRPTAVPCRGRGIAPGTSGACWIWSFRRIIPGRCGHRPGRGCAFLIVPTSCHAALTWPSDPARGSASAAALVRRPVTKANAEPIAARAPSPKLTSAMM